LTTHCLTNYLLRDLSTRILRTPGTDDLTGLDTYVRWFTKHSGDLHLSSTSSAMTRPRQCRARDHNASESGQMAPALRGENREARARRLEPRFDSSVGQRRPRARVRNNLGKVRRRHPAGAGDACERTERAVLW